MRSSSLSNFFQEVSDSPSLKFTLAWGTFLGLVVPTALLMTLGVPERVALLVMVLLILPFQYVLFRVLPLVEKPRGLLPERKQLLLVLVNAAFATVACSLILMVAFALPRLWQQQNRLLLTPQVLAFVLAMLALLRDGAQASRLLILGQHPRFLLRDAVAILIVPVGIFLLLLQRPSFY